MLRNISLALFTAMISIMGCSKSEEASKSYDVAITITSPTSTSAYDASMPIPIDIGFSREGGGKIHNLTVEVKNQSGTVIETLVDRHVHQDSPYDYSLTDLTLATGNYTLDVVTSNLTDDQSATKASSFTVQ